jgi:hypothetical protein
LRRVDGLSRPIVFASLARRGGVTATHSFTELRKGANATTCPRGRHAKSAPFSGLQAEFPRARSDSLVTDRECTTEIGSYLPGSQRALWSSPALLRSPGFFPMPRLRITRDLEIVNACHRPSEKPSASCIFTCTANILRHDDSTKTTSMRRAAITQADLLRTLRAAQAAGWEQPCRTIIRLRPGTADPVSAPNGRGLDVVP